MVLSVFFACRNSIDPIPTDTYIFTEDSLKIVNAFQKALQIKDSSAFYLAEAEGVYNKPPINEIKTDVFIYERNVFEFKTGNFENALVISRLWLALKAKWRFKEAAKFYNLQGTIYSYKKEYSKAIASFKKALEILEALNDNKNLAYANNNIANNFIAMDDFESAYKYASISYDIVKENKNDSFYPSILAVLSICETSTNRKMLAKSHATEALRLSKNTSNVVPWVLSLYALGDVAQYEELIDSAIHYMTQSLELSNTYNLHNYALINMTALLNYSVRNGQFNEAIAYGEKAIELSKALQNQSVLLSLNKNLSKAHAGLGQVSEALDYLNEAFVLKEEISRTENKEIVHDLLLKYESEKKDKELSQTRISILEKDIEINRNQSIIYFLIIAAAISILLVVVVVIIKRQQYQKIVLQRESDLLKANMTGEQKERLRFSRELHDGIASELIGLKIQAEEKKIAQDWIEKLSDVHQEVRRISHNLSPLKIEHYGLIEAVKLFCLENQNKNTEIHFFSNIKREVREDRAQVIYRVGQELIQNALKYAEASNIDVQIFQELDILRITVEDNGIGMNKSELSTVIEKTRSHWQAIPFLIDIHGDSQEGNGASVTAVFSL